MDSNVFYSPIMYCLEYLPVWDNSWKSKITVLNLVNLEWPSDESININWCFGLRFPFDVNKSPTHEIIYVLIVITGCVFVPFGLGALDGLMFYFVANIWVQFRMMNQALRAINSENHDEKHIYKELCFITKQHLFLKK